MTRKQVVQEGVEKEGQKERKELEELWKLLHSEIGDYRNKEEVMKEVIHATRYAVL